ARARTRRRRADALPHRRPTPRRRRTRLRRPVLDREVVLPTLLRRRAEEEPERIYLRDSDGRAWSYGTLEREVQAWSGALAAAGVAPGDRVVVMLPSRLEAVAVWLAAARLGAIEVPLNTAYRGRILEHVPRNAGARCAVVA